MSPCHSSLWLSDEAGMRTDEGCCPSEAPCSCRKEWVSRPGRERTEMGDLASSGPFPPAQSKERKGSRVTFLLLLKVRLLRERFPSQPSPSHRHWWKLGQTPFLLQLLPVWSAFLGCGKSCKVTSSEIRKEFFPWDKSKSDWKLLFFLFFFLNCVIVLTMREIYFEVNVDLLYHDFPSK